MKLPTLDEALAAIGALTGTTDAINSAAHLVDIVTGLFDGQPDDQAALKAKFEEQEAAALAALDRLDAAIDEAEQSG